MAERDFQFEIYDLYLYVTHELEKTIKSMCEKYGSVDFSWYESQDEDERPFDIYPKAVVYLNKDDSKVGFAQILKIQAADENQKQQDRGNNPAVFNMTVRLSDDQRDITLTGTLDNLIYATDDLVGLLRGIDNLEYDMEEAESVEEYSEEDALATIEDYLNFKWDPEYIEDKKEFDQVIQELQKLATQELSFDEINEALDYQWRPKDIFTFDKDDKAFLKKLRQLFQMHIKLLEENCKFD